MTVEDLMAVYTMEDLEAWVAVMPLDVKAVLSHGPIDEDHGYVRGESCRVCMALRPHARTATMDMYYLSEWHNAVSEPTEWYLRCLLIYLMAGWNGGS
jgi:hypothetical protein